MIQVFVNRSGSSFELPVQTLTWSGEKYRAPRKLDCTIISTTKGLHQKAPIDVGNQIIFKWKGEELFRGQIFSKVNSSDDTLSISAYDSLTFLLRNEHSQVFVNKSLSEVLKSLCATFQIPIGKIVDVPTKITRNFEAQTLFDIIMTYISLTFKKTGIRYYIYDRQGKIYLVKRTDQISKWVIEDGANLMSYRLEESIEDVFTQVKLIGTINSEIKKKVGKKVTTEKVSKTVIATVDSPATKKLYGLMQHVEYVNEVNSQADLLSQAKAMLKEKSKVAQTFDVDVLGISSVVAGSAIYVSSKTAGVERGFFVDSDTHTFEGLVHTMSLTLTKADDVPVLDSSTPIEKEEKKPAKSTKTNKKKKDKKGKDTFYDDLISSMKAQS